MASWNNTSATKTERARRPLTHSKEAHVLPGSLPFPHTLTVDHDHDYDHSATAAQMRPWPDMHKLQPPEPYLGDTLARRASTSHIAIHGGPWDQPEVFPLHKYSYSSQMTRPCDNILANPTNAPHLSRGAHDLIPLFADLYDTGSDRVPLSQADAGYTIHAMSNLNSDNGPVSLLHSVLGSGRRNSRVPPNPIQPPSVHAGRPLIERQNLKGQDPSQDTIQHGGFVPGYNIWASRDDQQTPEITSTLTRGYLARPDLQNQRRKSESVLYELGAMDPMYAHHDTIYQQGVNSSTVPSLYASVGISTRPASPLDGKRSKHHQSGLGTLGGSHGMSLPLGTFGERHPLSPLDQEFGFPGTNSQLPVVTKASRPHVLSQTQTLMQATNPHSQDSFSTRQHGGNASQFNNNNGLCGLCNVQRAVISMGGCGHRVCNVCHRHEKHRAMRLFQSSTPPCPFCAHGVVPMPGQTSASLSAQTSGVDSFKQRTLSLSQLHLPSVNQQLQLPQQQRHNKQKPGFQGQGPYDESTFEDVILGYPYNRHSYNTFPFVTSQAVTSEPSESAHGGKTIVTDRGSVDYPGYIFQPQQQGSTSRPPAGAFPQQVPVACTYAQQPTIHPLVSNPPHMQSNLACVGVTEVHQDNGFAAMSRPGITISSTGAAWRENPTEYDTQILLPFAQQPKVTPLRQYQHQKRGSSQQTIFQTSIISLGHQSHGHGHGLHAKPMALSFSMLPNLPSAAPPTVPRTEAIQWAVVRVTNIPWDISLHDMQSFFSDVPHPPEHLLPQNVHILMDRTTGKTFNFAFIELAVTPQQAGLVVQARHLKLLKGRVVSVELSNQNELMRSVFPKWSGEFIHGDPVIPGEQLIDPRTSSIAESPQEEGFSLNAVEDGDHQDVHEGASNHPTTVGMDSSLCRSNLRSTPLTKGTLSGSSTNSISAALGNVVRAHVPAIPAFVTRDEINALLVVCRNYKLHFSRKCAERPFENIISILVKYPWHQPHRVLPLHRDHIFELLKLSIESLRMHLSKETTTIDPTLLTRIVRSAILSPAFTERQKAMVLHVAGCLCPEDIVGWMTPPALTENEVIKGAIEDSPQGSDDSADNTNEDSQETAPESPPSEEVKTRIEDLVVSNEMGTSPAVMMLTKSQLSGEHDRDSHDADDRGMLHSGTGASGIDTPPMDTSSLPHAPSAMAAQQASKSSGPPTPSPCTAEDDGSQDTDYD